MANGQAIFRRRPIAASSVIDEEFDTYRGLSAVFCGLFSPKSVSLCAETFDAITMFQVLEHIAEFDQMLADCRQILRPGGLLVISVPDGDAMRALEELTGCFDVTPNHINKWTPKSLSLAIQRNGLAPQPPVMEPHSLQSYLCLAGLKLLARMTTRPKSLAGKANGLQKRILRKGVLAALLAAELLRSLPQFSRMSRGLSLLMVGRKT
jgi:SAM-dependent methyltransferase